MPSTDTKTQNEVTNEFFIHKYKSKLTMNNYGKMSLSETPHFSLVKNMADKCKPILDIGCAYGFTSKALLEKGFKVIANDLSEEHFVYGFLDINDEQRERLTLKPCSMLELDFEENSLSGIVALNVIHFLKGTEIREMFKKFYKWLAPNGFLCVSGASPYFLKDINQDDDLTNLKIRTFFERFNNKVEWPGEDLVRISDLNFGNSVLAPNLPTNPHWLSTEILAREAILACLKIFKLDYFNENHEGYNELNENKNKLFTSIICLKEV